MIARNALNYLKNWKDKPHRKPLVMRGARQVGKSSLTREFGRSEFENLIEINLEADPTVAQLIVNRPIRESLELLSARFKKTIVPGKTLVFFDEIQARPDLFSSLRYWCEEMPSLHVIAAGSLLDFALRETQYPMPVGRIEYCFLGPLSFEEFLNAVGDHRLVELLADFHIGDEIPNPIHVQLLRRVRDYWIVGGMPEAVAAFAFKESFADAEEIKRSITSTYRDDFGKYGTRLDLELVRKVYQKVPMLVGQRAKLIEYDRTATSTRISKALELLSLARVITRVRHSAGNGIPLGAQADDKLTKYLFVDIGLQLTLCDIDRYTLEKSSDLLLVNSGSLAEQFVGQHLLYLRPMYYEPELYYWERSKKNASAEVDYLITSNSQVFPIEVKAGATGRLRSLQLFATEKGSKTAIRFYSGTPRKDELGSLQLISLPLYLINQVERLTHENSAG